MALSSNPYKHVVAALTTLAGWGDIELFLEHNPPAQSISNGRERMYRRTLRDADTFAIALLLVMRRLEGGKPYTLGELAKAIEAGDYSLQKSAQGRIKTVLERVGDHYGLIKYGVSLNPRDGQDSYQIEASEKLMKFFENFYLPAQLENLGGLLNP